MNRRQAWVAMGLLAGVVLAGGTAGCGRSYVRLDSANYIPKFPPADFADYQNKSVYMPSFANRADNTTIFYYYGADGSRTYGGPVLASYFWYCFKNAFSHIGVRVYDRGAPQSVPKLEVEFPALSEVEYQFTVNLDSPGHKPFRKTYKVPAPPPASDDSTYLAERAYTMNDLAFTNIIYDPEFRAAFMEAQGPAAAPHPTAAPSAVPPAPEPPSPTPPGSAPSTW
jgi:hypothetical protein